MPETPAAAHDLITLGQFGERARPLRQELREAALVIGLGQVGLYAVAQVRAMLDVMLTRRDMQTQTRLLAIARHRSIRDEMILPRDERLMLNLDLPPWSDVPGRYAQLGVAQWWPHSPRAREVLDDPTQVRAYSRLMLYDNAALLSDALYKLMQWLLEAGTGRDLKLEKRVYVLASLAEAESSGMVFDVITRLRALAGKQNVTIAGVFSLRGLPVPHDPDHVMAMANAYAALREIDNWMLHPEMFTSLLPVIGHGLTRTSPQRALDLILLADDAAAEELEQPPQGLLAELVTTWIASSLGTPSRASAWPAPIPFEPGSDRFSGYSTFGVSKLALPVRAVMDLAAVGLAQTALNAARGSSASSAAQWASQQFTQGRQVVLASPVLDAPPVGDRLRTWAYDLSAAGLSRALDAQAARGETNRMADLVQSEMRRLERERVTESVVEQSAVSALPDSLRNRIDTALAQASAEFQTALLAAPVGLAYERGFGLLWAQTALEELQRHMRGALHEIGQTISEAQAANQLSRQALLRVAGEYDTKTGGRFGSARKAALAELDTCARQVLQTTAAHVVAEAHRNTWEKLIRLLDDLRDQIRDALSGVEQATLALQTFESSARAAVEQALYQPPVFPAGVVLAEDWYTSGIRDLTSMSQLPPQDLLSQVYRAWMPGDLPADRRLSRFLSEIQDAARRALAGVFRFDDLAEFLAGHSTSAFLQQALAALPGAATPALVPTHDDSHPPPVPYELVREVPRSISALKGPQSGVSRCTVPSPDPDEITVIRVLHGLMAEAIPALREAYRRAYDRAGAEGMSLHIDRRWDSTMADLVHTTARREISVIWESLLSAVGKSPQAVRKPLDALVRALGVALDVRDTGIMPNLPADLHLVVYKLPPFRLKLPPPTCALLFVCSNRAAEDIAEDVFRAVTPLPLEEQFVFLVNITGRRDMDRIVEPLRRVDFITLVLDEADIKHLISARLPTRALSDLVLSQVNLNTISPFYTRGPVPEHMFFGREREINEVRSKLRTHSVALIGGRRIGKTSTLQRIQRLLKPRDSEYVPYYLDCHGATNYDTFFWLVNRRWEVDIAQAANPVQFEDVVTKLQARHPGKGIAILFDEVDSLLEFDRKPENQETLFRTFRSLSNEKRCQYVFSGEKWLMRAISNPYSALFNFTQAVRLEPLPPKVVHHLVADPFEMLNIWMEQSEQIVERIYQISAGHPNIVQMICQAMIEELDHDPQNANLLNFEHLDHATSRRTLQEEIVQTIWGQMNPLARLITLTWPEGVRILTLAQIETLLRGIELHDIPPERLEATAKDLELYCFVRPRDNDRLELIPMAFPAILDFMTDRARQIEIVRREYALAPDGAPR